MNEQHLFSNDNTYATEIEIPDGKLEYHQNFFDKDKSDYFFELLKTSIEWEQHHIQLFGKKHLAPRLSAWYGDEGAKYTYSGLELHPAPMPEILLELRETVNKAAQSHFNSVLLNLYRNGNDSMGWHSDDETELGKNPTIASLNFGASRKFALKHKSLHYERREIQLHHGSLLIMSGTIQHYWKHCVPKTKKMVSDRINLTFRNII